MLRTPRSPYRFSALTVMCSVTQKIAFKEQRYSSGFFFWLVGWLTGWFGFVCFVINELKSETT